MNRESLGQRFGIQLSTMGVPTTAQGPASVRFAPYIEELQEFFASACLRYGSPEDIIALTERLESSPTFAEDLSSMIRSIVLREGGEMPHSQMLEVLALAIGGQKMDHSPQHFAQPLRNLLSFMTTVLKKPWNEPPGETARDQEHSTGERVEPESGVRPHVAPHTDGVLRAERGEVLPFPAKCWHPVERSNGQAAAISAAADRARHAEQMEKHGPVPIKPDFTDHLGSTDDPLSDGRRRREVPDLVGEPTPPERSAFDPATPADEAFQDPDFPEDISDADASTAVTLPAKPPLPLSSKPVASRGTNAGLTAGHPPVQPEPNLPAPSWKIAAEGVRGAGHVDLPAVKLPNPATAHPDAVARPEPRPERPVASAGSSVFQPPQPKAPLAGTTAPGARTVVDENPAGRWYAPRVPRSPAGILVAGAAVLVFAGIIAAEFWESPVGLTGKQPAPSAASPTAASARQVTAVPQVAAVAPALSTVPMTTPALTRVRHVPRADDDEEIDENGVARPYSTPIPQQAVAAKPSPYVPQEQQQASAAHELRPPSNEVASTIPQAGGSSGTHEYEPQAYAGGQSTVHPGVLSSYRGSEPAVAADVSRSSRGSRTVTQHPTDQIDVSPGMMAGYVLSAPKPDYPGLARIAHIGGPVVLQAVVAKNGTVLATHVLSGHRLLRGAAEDAVRQWRFRPYMMDGHAVEVSTIVTVRFNPSKK